MGKKFSDGERREAQPRGLPSRTRERGKTRPGSAKNETKMRLARRAKARLPRLPSLSYFLLGARQVRPKTVSPGEPKMGLTFGYSGRGLLQTGGRRRGSIKTYLCARLRSLAEARSALT